MDPSSHTGLAAPAAVGADTAWLRERLEELSAIPRPSASEGEREAAEWIVERFAELGVEARIEAEDAHGTYWWPLGIGAAAGALGGVAALCSCNQWKNPSYYHWANDVPENVDYGTFADGIRLVDGVIRRLDERWLD